jgi:release factor glutamine methyltransferase
LISESAHARPESGASELIGYGQKLLDGITGASRLEAELLLAEATGTSRAWVIANGTVCIDEDARQRYRAMLDRRRHGEPFAYLTGRQEFYSLTLAVTPAVLVPRPETELLVDAALTALGDGDGQILELGTGSGAVALALKQERPDIAVTAVDCQESAVALAAENAAALALDIEWLESDWFAAVNGRRFDLIVANPPYVAQRLLVNDHALAYEPAVALDGGADGLAAYRVILGGAPDHLARGGRLLLEHGHDQRSAIAELAARHDLVVDTQLDDLAGLPRVIGMRRAGH